MKKALASGIIGLVALGGVAVGVPAAFAQDADNDYQARIEARSERKAEKIETLTSVLGLDIDVIRAAKQDGQSIADIAADQGVDVQSVIDALMQNVQARIDARVEDGRLDADGAADRAERAEDRITDRVNRTRGERDGEGRRGRGYRGHHGQSTEDGAV